VKALLTSFKLRVFNILGLVHASALRIKARAIAVLEKCKVPNLVDWAKQYTPSQLCYFLAISLLIINIFIEGDYAIWIALLAFVGLLRELFNIFHRVWDTAIGKGFIVITYASTVNFALAFAALKINAITGVEPMPFVFTLGFTTLILMPFWIALSSVILFLTVLILANLWLLVSLLLRIVGIKLKVHWEDKKRAVLTMLMRIILIPIVLLNLFAVMLPFSNTDFVSGPLQFDGPLLTINLGDEDSDSLQTDTTETESIQNNQEAEDILESLHETQLLVEKAIANFIFYLEAYPNSACQKSDEQRSVIIDENMLLLISKNEEAPHGFDYAVAKCVPRLNAIQEHEIQ
jgi:hypothetical protein